MQRQARSTRTATASSRNADGASRQVQQLHDGGRPADRLGLLRPGPRRPDLQDEDRNSLLRHFSCFVWVVDAHPEDINKVDFVAPDGTPKWPRSATSARRTTRSFNVGLNSGTAYEYEDTANRLHFYILGTHTDAKGILHYTVGVKSLDGTGPQARGVSLASPRLGNAEGYTTCTFNLTNTGAAAAAPDVHPQDASAYLDSDIYRLSTSATGTGWTAYLKNALATAKFGESVSVPVYVEKGTGSGSVTLKAVSESDPSKTASAVCTLADGSVGGTVPATLALTMGTPAAFGAFTPGLGKDYYATTSANVVSTAGDATLTRRRPGHDQHRPPGQRRVRAAGGRCRRAGPTAPTRRRRLPAPTTLKTCTARSPTTR